MVVTTTTVTHQINTNYFVGDVNIIIDGSNTYYNFKNIEIRNSLYTEINTEFSVLTERQIVLDILHDFQNKVIKTTKNLDTSSDSSAIHMAVLEKLDEIKDNISITLSQDMLEDIELFRNNPVLYTIETDINGNLVVSQETSQVAIDTTTLSYTSVPINTVSKESNIYISTSDRDLIFATGNTVENTDFITCDFSDFICENITFNNIIFKTCNLNEAVFKNPLNASSLPIKTVKGFESILNIDTHDFQTILYQDSLDYTFKLSWKLDCLPTLQITRILPNSTATRIINNIEFTSKILLIEKDITSITFANIQSPTIEEITLFTTFIETKIITTIAQAKLVISDIEEDRLDLKKSSYSIDILVNGITKTFTGLVNFTEFSQSSLILEDITRLDLITDITKTFSDMKLIKGTTQETITDTDYLYIVGDSASFYMEGVGPVSIENQITGTKLITVGSNSYTYPGGLMLVEGMLVNKGSLQILPIPKINEQSYYWNLFVKKTFSFTKTEFFDLTNIKNSSEIDFDAVPLITFPDLLDGTSIYNERGELTNKVSIEFSNNRYIFTLLYNSECEFAFNINFALKNIKTLSKNNINNYNQTGLGKQTIITGRISMTVDYNSDSSITLGDPHITTISGNIYELPQKVANYRLLQGTNLNVNVSTRSLLYQEKEDIKDYYRKITDDAPPKSLVTKGVVYDRIIIYYKESVVNYSFTKDTLQVIGTQILILNKHCIKIIDNVMGNLILNFKHYVNPQEKYGIELSCNKLENVTGLLINEYIASSMAIDNLLNKEPKEGIIGKNNVYTKLFSM